MSYPARWRPIWSWTSLSVVSQAWQGWGLAVQKAMVRVGVAFGAGVAPLFLLSMLESGSIGVPHGVEEFGPALFNQVTEPVGSGLYPVPVLLGHGLVSVFILGLRPADPGPGPRGA